MFRSRGGRVSDLLRGSEVEDEAEQPPVADGPRWCLNSKGHTDFHWL